MRGMSPSEVDRARTNARADGDVTRISPRARFEGDERVARWRPAAGLTMYSLQTARESADNDKIRIGRASCGHTVCAPRRFSCSM